MRTYGTKKILPVYGNSRPVERRINNQKIAGWKEQSFNATSVSQNDTYNDSAYLRIYGKSEQVGIPSPDYPSTINSVSNFDLVSSDGGSKTQTINFPYTLRSLPDGTKDYIEIDNVNKTAKLYRNVGEYILNGSETWTLAWDLMGFTRFFTRVSTLKVGQSNSTVNLMSDKLASKSWNDKYMVSNNVHTYNGDNRIGLRIDNSIIGVIDTDSDPTKVTKLKTWLTANPVTAQYQLATPIVEDLDYNEVKTYYPYTQIYTNATIQPTLDGSLKIIDRDEE